MIERRDFLRLTCAAAVATAGGVLNGGTWSTGSTWLSIGFASESEIADVRDFHGGDASFLRDGARISVSASPAGVNFALTALFPIEIDGVRRLVPFAAASKSSVPVRFAIPVDPDDGVAFELMADAGHRRILRFTVNPRDGAIPLRRGTYILAVTGERTATDWRSLDLSEERGFPVLKSRFDERALPFSPLFLRFDVISLSS